MLSLQQQRCCPAVYWLHFVLPARMLGTPRMIMTDNMSMSIYTSIMFCPFATRYFTTKKCPITCIFSVRDTAF